jgi:hypothetical protein
MKFRLLGLVAVISMTALFCNPAKRALDQKRLIDEAIAQWILENPIPVSEILVPGDSIIVRDTSWLPYLVWDTLMDRDTVRVVQIRYRTVREIVNVRDTLVRTVNNTEAIVKLNEDKSFLQGRLTASENAQRKQSLWLLILTLLSIILILLILKRR